MKCKTKAILMASVIAVTITTTAFATVGSRTAELFYNNIKVKLNGKEIIPTDANGNAIEPFTIDGTTYLPVRGVASALGLNVGWDAETKTVILDNPGVFQGGVQVYNDDFVTIEFAGCTVEKEYEWSDIKYYANFNIKNKTDAELTFDVSTIAFDGISYKISGMESVAPQSTGKISFRSYDAALPTTGIGNTSGKIRVIDMDNEVSEFDYDYDAKWVNVTQK